jgi:hypothetical protein
MCRGGAAPEDFYIAPRPLELGELGRSEVLTPDENEELGRIHTLAQFGKLPTTMQQRFDELKARSETMIIPEPTLDIQWMPQQRTREEALDDLMALYAADDEPAPEPVVAEVELPNTHTSLADMAAFEAQMAGEEYYVASPHTGGFTPSSWYRAT